MNAYNANRLRSDFPDLYKPMLSDRSRAGSPILADCFEFECGDGWLDLIHSLSEAISSHAMSVGLQVAAVQVKEKYGVLRFYVDVGDEEIFRLIDVAEEASELICEVCGLPGGLTQDRWLTTRCGECAAPA